VRIKICCLPDELFTALLNGENSVRGDSDLEGREFAMIYSFVDCPERSFNFASIRSDLF
jgi:hypothetical protein